MPQTRPSVARGTKDLWMTPDPSLSPPQGAVPLFPVPLWPGEPRPWQQVNQVILPGLKVLSPGDGFQSWGFHRGHFDLIFFFSFFLSILNPKSFLKNLDFYVSGCSIFHVNDPNNYMYLAANPHLTICCRKDNSVPHEWTNVFTVCWSFSFCSAAKNM